MYVTLADLNPIEPLSETYEFTVIIVESNFSSESSDPSYGVILIHDEEPGKKKERVMFSLHSPDV